MSSSSKAKLFEEEKRLPDDFVREIGRVSVAFARMEIGFEVVFAGLIDKNQQIGRALWSLFGGLDSRLNAILSVYSVRYGQDGFFEQLQSLISEANLVAAERHKIVHSAYGTGEDGTVGRIRTIRAKKGFRVDLEDNITPESIRKIAESIVGVSQKLVDLTNALMKADRIPDYAPKE